MEEALKSKSEGQGKGKGKEGVWIVTSWSIVDGCIDDAVTYESSSISNDKALPLPLVLHHPDPHSVPCQITFHFEKQHEIKQVYVRSSARVYEIYYTTTTPTHTHDDIDNQHQHQHQDQQYLCTVPCAPVATLNEEDGWVDVTLFPPQQHNHFQDLFEATAEVADAHPLLSVTLRLLSIQTGDYLYVDQVYVFADPVVSHHLHSSANTTTENSSPNNALMSMLIPTLLHMSKSQTTQFRQCNDSSATLKGKEKIAENMASDAAFISNALHSKMLDGKSVPLQVPCHSNSPYSTTRDILSTHIQRSLDELVSRVANIEQFCFKFEQNLLKPMSSIEARLVKIEEQLESFVKSPHMSATSCANISAPESSYHEPESNPMCNDGNESPLTRKWDSTSKDDCLIQELLVTSSDASLSTCFVQSSSSTVPQLIPSLVVTAPDFSSIDDAEDNNTAESVNNLPNDCLKKPLSINDALASALAGLLSSASADPLEYIDKVEEVADFLGVEPPVFIQSDEPVLPTVLINESKTTTSLSCKDLVLREQESPSACNNCKDKQDHNFQPEGCKKHVDLSADNVITLDKYAAEDCNLTVEVGFGEADNDINHYLDTRMLFGSGTSEKESISTSEVPKVPDVLHNILKLPSPSMVDFGNSLLDIKFSSLEDSSAISPLEALLTDIPGIQDKVRSVKENSESSLSGENDLVMIENEESSISEKVNESCLANCDFGYMSSSNTEHKEQYLHEFSNQDMHASLI